MCRKIMLELDFHKMMLTDTVHQCLLTVRRLAAGISCISGSKEQLPELLRSHLKAVGRSRQVPDASLSADVAVI